MNFWNQLIGEPRPAEIKTEINLYAYNSDDIISLVMQGIITRQEVIDSNVIESMFNKDLEHFIYSIKRQQTPTLVIADQLTSP